MKSRSEYLSDYQTFCESALLDALSKFNGCYHMDSIAVMESTMRDFKAGLYGLKSLLYERITLVVSELQFNGAACDNLRYELVIIASRTLRSFISTTAPHSAMFKR